MITKHSPSNKKREIDAWFDMTIDKAFVKKSKTMTKKYEKAYGIQPLPSLYHPVEVHWAVKEAGFGSFTFYSVNGELHCKNEMMSKSFIKIMFNLLVDKAILDNPPRKS
jgi:hypothetical protein